MCASPSEGANLAFGLDDFPHRPLIVLYQQWDDNVLDGNVWDRNVLDSNVMDTDILDGNVQQQGNCRSYGLAQQLRLEGFAQIEVQPTVDKDADSEAQTDSYSAQETW